MPSNEAQRGQLFAILGEAFRQRFTPTTLAAYELGLSDIDPDRLKAVIAKAIQTLEFCPNPAKLREMAGASNAQDSIEGRALVAWAAVDRAVDTVGSYRSVTFSDPVINAAIRNLGGWPQLCGQSTEEFNKWSRQNFLKAYAQLARSGVSADASRPLEGLGGQSGEVKRINGTRGLVAPKPAVQVDVDSGEMIGLPAPVAPIVDVDDGSGISADQSIPRLEVRKP